MKIGYSFLLLAAAAHAAPSVITAGNTDTGYTNVAPAINAVLGAGKVDNPIFNDIYNAVNNNNIIAASGNTGLTFNSIASGNPVNHAPYQVISSSFTPPPNLDQNDYATLEAQGTLFSLPLVSRGTTAARQAPPIIGVISSSQNSSDGGSTWGIEFGLSSSYLGLNTSDDSHTAPAVAGFLAALMYNHVGFNIFDVKASLRQTSGNWATGYDNTAFGFGFVNWAAANAITLTSALYLQGPGFQVTNHIYYASLVLYPFKSTRRANEAIYSVSAAYSWPVKNEYTATDIAASGATLLYTSNGTDVTPTYTYSPGTSGAVTFVAFTLDGLGGYSRVESFSTVTTSLIVGTMCLN